jgi:hypothetical protein
MPYTPLETTAAFMKGYFSYREKIDEAENPYQFNTKDYLDWRKGWYQAKKDTKAPLWRCATFWSGLIFILLGIVVVSFEIPVVQENPRFLGVGLATYGIGSILLKVISGQAYNQPLILPTPLFRKRRNETETSKKDN